MQHNPHHAMNGRHPNDGASTAYDDYPASHSGQPLFNNHHSPNQHHQQQPQSQSIPLPPPNQWSQGMQMNGQNQPMPQHQSPFNQPPWGNQMPPLSSFPNTMPGFNMNFIPQQVLQEAYALSVAVDASDEPTLVSTLLSGRKRGMSYKEALNSLHAKGGHSASLWKDYYLDHKDRIDAWIAMCLQKDNDMSSVPRDDISKSTSLERGPSALSSGTAKKPSFKDESSSSHSARIGISAPPVKLPKKPIQSTPPLPIDQSLNNGRSTINSITAPAPVFGNRLPAPNAEIKIPDPPSRSPSPPTNIIPQGRGNKYTQEDREFFVKFVGWRLKQDPSHTRQEICDLLAKKAPHHSVQSWASHWSNNHDIPDKILAAARGIELDAEESDSGDEAVPVKQRSKYKDVTTSEESEESTLEAEDDSESEDDESDQMPLRRWTEDDMGEKGGPFTDADNYIAAKYLASFPDFERASSRELWGPFHDKHPQRTAKSWAEYYRRNGRVVEKLVKRIRREENNPIFSAVSSIYTQCARPTVAPKEKRKHIDSDDDGKGDDEMKVKRKRGRPSLKL